jgi:hypothetical protein
MKNHFENVNQREKRDNNMKDHMDHKTNHHNNSFKRINATKTINLLINSIAGMGIRKNKLQQIISYMEENHFDILLAQKANVDFKDKTTQG